MVQPHLLLTALMLCSSAACSPGSPVPWSPGHQLKEILHLLVQLQMTPSHKCLDDNRPEFRLTIQKTEATCVNQLMLQHIFNLFKTQEARAAWDKQVLKELLSRLAESLEPLVKSREEPVFCTPPRLALLKYFRSRFCYLQKERYSSCAWEIVREEVRKSLSHISDFHTEVSN
ncbi:interferon alpha-2-like [Dipodomys spectabilis]|uniref:interferon alpha-2-like n=1 Tax=Dipodomys spectabilis TaxID=105255 RepID=UPI001C54808F|nr:interferon alpha-2-like [Dipodomys spectabilis]